MRATQKSNAPAPAPAQAAGGNPQIDAQQAEFPALLRAEELSGQYYKDLWRQAGTVARQRGSFVQRTVEDISLADVTLRSGFRRRRVCRKVVGQALTVVGAMFAGVGINGQWPHPDPSPGAPWSLIFLVGGLVLAFCGVSLAYSAD